MIISQKIVVDKLTSQELSTLCESVIKSLEDPPTTYSEEASEFWNAIISDMPFDWYLPVVNIVYYLCIH